MKTIKFLTILIIGVLLYSCNGEKKSKTVSQTNTTSRIEVIDFYGARRCTTCKAIEASAKHTVDTYFSKEQKNGTVIFKTINVEDKKNETIAESFEAAGTALFLNVIKDGKETHIDLTNFGFSKGRDQEIFSKELKAKIETELKLL